MPPKQRVDLDLDALAPPNRTIRLQGKVYELPGDMPISLVVRAMQLQGQMESAESEDESEKAISALLEIIHDLFRQNNPEYVEVDLSLSNVMNILGLVLSGMDIDFEQAVQEALIGDQAEETEEAEGDDHPPTSPAAESGKETPARRSRSRKLSPAPS